MTYRSRKCAQIIFACGGNIVYRVYRLIRNIFIRKPVFRVEYLGKKKRPKNLGGIGPADRRDTPSHISLRNRLRLVVGTG